MTPLEHEHLENTPLGRCRHCLHPISEATGVLRQTGRLMTWNVHDDSEEDGAGGLICHCGCPKAEPMDDVA